MSLFRHKQDYVCRPKGSRDAAISFWVCPFQLGGVLVKLVKVHVNIPQMSFELIDTILFYKSRKNMNQRFSSCFMFSCNFFPPDYFAEISRYHLLVLSKVESLLVLLC